MGLCLVGIALLVSTKCTNVLPWLGDLYLIETLYVLWTHHKKETEKRRKARSEHLVHRELILFVGRKYEKKKKKNWIRKKQKKEERKSERIGLF